jgi:broad-specificity NMP kinase
MNKSILITGVSGSGKSLLCDELKKRGYKAYDIEELHGLFAMVNKKTGKVADVFDNQNLESIKQHDWICDKKKLKELVRKNSGKVVLDDMVFYCGTASNTDDLLHMFDKVFLLKAGEKVTRKRLATRKSNNFGRTDDVQEWVLTWKDWWENHMLEKGAIIIDANRNVQEIAIEIINRSKAE